MSNDIFKDARVMGDFRPAPGRLKPPKAAEVAVSMRAIAGRAASLLVEVDALLGDVEDYVLAHGPHWHKGQQGAIYTRNMEELRRWRDFVQEIGEDSLTWE